MKIKIGLWISGILIVGLLIIITTTFTEDLFFYNSDVIERLSEHNIVLKDNFTIISNKTTGFTDYSHQFLLTISPADRKRLIDKIKSHVNYQVEVQDMFDLREGKIRYSEKDTVFTANYKDEWNYSYQYYKPNKKGYKPTWDIISISKTKNELTYIRILE